MDDRTTLLFVLSDFRVLDVTLAPDGGRRALVESVADEGGCPACGKLVFNAYRSIRYRVLSLVLHRR